MRFSERCVIIRSRLKSRKPRAVSAGVAAMALGMLALPFASPLLGAAPRLQHGRGNFMLLHRSALLLICAIVALVRALNDG